MPIVVITGANRGIGLAMATVYAARGDRVIGTARDPARAAALAALGRDVECLPLDVTSEESLAALARTLSGRPIDILVANSGVLAARGGIADPQNTAAAWANVLATNVTGPFLTIRALLPNLAAAKGRIAIISSRVGSSIRTGPERYAYRASKAAATNLALNLSLELRTMGVAVAAYHPGWVRTDMGGPGGDIDADVSASNLVRQIDALSLANTGAFINYDGTTIPY
jgi:NAD(P)-dependent dehydrogenase (short-subunit alcohol dehydrogenase family)